MGDATGRMLLACMCRNAEPQTPNFKFRKSSRLCGLRSVSNMQPSLSLRLGRSLREI